VVELAIPTASAGVSGERGGRVVLEQRLDGSRAIRFGSHYLAYEELVTSEQLARDDGKVPARPSEVSMKKLSKGWQPPADYTWRKRVVR
jgi:hypothetical protein